MTAVLDTLVHVTPSVPIFLHFKQSHQRWAGTELDIWHHISSSNLSFSSVERKPGKEWEDQGNGDGNPVAGCLCAAVFGMDTECSLSYGKQIGWRGMEGFVCFHFYFGLKKMAMVASRLHTVLAVLSLMPHLFFPFFT